jgi:hypothetical protein
MDATINAVHTFAITIQVVANITAGPVVVITISAVASHPASNTSSI